MQNDFDTVVTSSNHKIKILENKGFLGANLENRPLPITFLFLNEFSNSFQIWLKHTKDSLKNMVRGVTFWPLIGVLETWKIAFLSLLENICEELSPFAHLFGTLYAVYVSILVCI